MCYLRSSLSVCYQVADPQPMETFLYKNKRFTPKCSLKVQSILTVDLLHTTSGTARDRVFSN